MSDRGEALLGLHDVVKHYPRGVRAVDGVTLEVRPGEAVGLVGESGSGKSTLARLALALEPVTSGRVAWSGRDVGSLPARELRRARARVQLVFQDAARSLSPRRTVGANVVEGLVVHGIGTRRERQATVEAMLERCGLTPEEAGRMPHELSGGQRQRVAIARALVTRPDVVILDEPVSSLDVSVRAQILTLLATLRRDLGLALLLISHDLSVVRWSTDRVLVLRDGRVVEEGPTDETFRSPQHLYTRELLAAVPPHPRSDDVAAG